MSTYVPLPTGELVKPSRPHHRAIRVANMKPPERAYAPGSKAAVPHVRFVLPNGDEIKHRCTEEVFQTSMGVRRVNAAHSGLDYRTKHFFVLKVDPSTDLVDVIHAYPEIRVMHGLKRSEVPEHKHMVVSLNPASGQIIVEEIPDGLSNNHVEFAINALDSVGSLTAGQDIGWGMTIRSINGGVIYINLDNLNAAVPGGVDEATLFEVAERNPLG